MAYGLLSVDDASRKETILDVFQDATPKSTPLMTLFSTGKARGTVDQWVEDYQARSTTSTGKIEGADITYDDLTQPARRSNLTQIVTKNVKVSGTEAAVDVVGGQDPMSYQKGKALVGLKLQWENTIVNAGVKISGQSGVAAGMAGIISIVSSHATARNSGTSMSIQEVNDMVAENFNDVGIENMFDVMVCPMGIKQKIGQLTTPLTRNVNAMDKKLAYEVQSLATDGGDIKIIPHQDLNNASGTTAVLALNTASWQLAWLREPSYKPLASQGDNEKGAWISEGTLRFLAERTNNFRTGYNKAG
jgi:hypothetical protein